MKKFIIAALAMIAIGGTSSYSQSSPNATSGGYANVIRLTPIKAIDYGLGLGFGVEYERILLDKNIGIVLPIAVVYNVSPLQLSSQNNNVTYTYFNPGLKFYPGGIRKVTYAIGPSLIIGRGSGSSESTIFNPNGTQITRIENFVNNRFGMMVNNYLEFLVTPRFNFSMELGLGVRYVNKYVFSNREGYNDRYGLNANFGVSFGYKF